VSLGNDDHSRQPSRFALKQNFPNPFNPKTRIEYTLLTSGKVKLEVFNALGQLVTVLVSEEQTAGVRQVDFDGSQLASGVYYYRLSAAGKSQTLKMILVK
jgi:N-methylhydantoinase B/oxoprolinase/acetone carboxylase alpha subunit